MGVLDVEKVIAMIDKKMLISTVAVGWGMCAGVALPASGADNPIFGRAEVQQLSPAENKAVVGKGYYADYYGYYGIYYANLASQYGFLGYANKSYSYYGSAYNYAYNAAQDFYYAYQNQFNGT